jgi:hypothetical protein
MIELRSLLSTLFIDPLASRGFCPMRGSEGLRLVFERSLLLLLKLSVAPRSKAPLVATSDEPPIACAAEVANSVINTATVLTMDHPRRGAVFRNLAGRAKAIVRSHEIGR